MNFVQTITNTMKYSVASVVLAASVVSAAQAKEDNRDYVTGYVGYFDVIGGDHDAAQFGIEYRARAIQYSIRPVFGVNVTTDESVYGYAGLNWDAELIENQLYLIPSFVAGLYREGDGKDLGGAIEFRSGIELAYQFPNAHRLGAQFNHISNASIYDRNPGSETAMITYSIPLDNFR
jgi:lipid A 3-O-deacylase